MDSHDPPKPKYKFQRKKDDSDTPNLLMGWIFIIVVFFAITVMILYSKPQPRLVCDYRAGATLTKFGTCRPVR